MFLSKLYFLKSNLAADSCMCQTVIKGVSRAL